MKKRWIPVLLGVMMVVVAGSGCRSAGPVQAQSDPLASTAPVVLGKIQQVVTIAGQIVARNARELGFGASSGRVLEVLVQQGQEVTAGQPLVRLDTADQERKLREAEADVKVAEAAVAEAQITAGAAEITRAEATLAEAEYALAEAELKLEIARQTGVEALRQAVAKAQVALRLAQDQYRVKEISAQTVTIRQLEYDTAFLRRQLRDLPPGEERDLATEGLADAERKMSKARADRNKALRDAQDEIAAADDKLAKAEQALARVEAGTDDPTAAAQLAYAQADVQVQEAQKALDDLRAGADSAALKAAKTAYEAALAKVDAAKAAIEAATLTAPFDGMIFALYVAPGARVQPSVPVLYLADPSDLRVQAQATELDITRLQEGQDVRLTVDAYPGQTFSGKVLALPPQATPQGGGAGPGVYFVEIAVDPVPVSSGLVVRPGMLANARVITGEKDGVLTVPAAALRYEPPSKVYVLVVDSEGARNRVDIKVGLNDGIRAEILSGLTEGQTVVVPLVPPTDPNRFGGPMGGVMIERAVP